MSVVRRVATEAQAEKELVAQLFQDAAGDFWVRAANGDETRVGGGGSQSLVLKAYDGDNYALADPIVISAPFSDWVSVVLASPPDWLDGDGAIIAPGLFASGAFVQEVAAPTTPELVMIVGGWASADMLLNLDDLHTLKTLFPNQPVGLVENLSIPTDQLPYSATAVGVLIHLPADDTAQISVQPFVQRLIEQVV